MRKEPRTELLPAGDAEAALQPRRIDRYELRERIGRGGMGTVYRAVDTKLGRTVALKTATTSVAAARLSDRVRQRFLREAMALSQVMHRNVVQVLDFGFADDGTPFLVMEHLQGRDLGALLCETSSLLPIPRVVDIMLGVCAALRACHRVGIIHRDLKPENIFLAETDTGPEVKVLDFGVSKTPSADDLTREGQILGTPQFLAPEQIDGKVGPASDQYALGVMLYVCLTRHLPYEDHENRGLLRAIEAGRFRSPRALRPEVPEALEVIVLRAMQVSPADRFESVHAMGRAMWPLASPRGQTEWRTYYLPDAAPAPGAPAPMMMTRTQILDSSAAEATTDDELAGQSTKGSSNGWLDAGFSFETELRPARWRRWPWVVALVASIGVGTLAARRARRARVPAIAALADAAGAPPAPEARPAPRRPHPPPAEPLAPLSPGLPPPGPVPGRAPPRRAARPRHSPASTRAEATPEALLPNIDQAGIGIPSE